VHHLYHYCCSCLGKTVRVSTRDGRRYCGRVVRVTPEHLYLSSGGEPLGTRPGETYLAQHALGQLDNASITPVFFFFSPFIVPLAAIIGLTIVGTAPFWGRGPFYGPY
jgi:hypothetical protein